MTAKKKVTKIALQYSKKISTFVCIFWCVYRIATILAVSIAPEVSEALTKLVTGIDSVMMINLGFYCGNSVSEKAILAWMDTKEKGMEFSHCNEVIDEETSEG